MKNIFLDTNILIDLLLRDEYSEVVRRCLYEGGVNQCVFFISPLSVANFAYIARKLAKDTLYEYLQKILELFCLVPTTPLQVENAIRMEAKDFEDALQYQAALSSKADCIISRNAKDFYFSAIPVLSPMEFLQEFNV